MTHGLTTHIGVILTSASLRLACRATAAKKAQSGFTYLGVIFFVAVIGALLAAAGTMWAVAKQREQEKQLLFVGNQFRRAIQLYYERTPGPIKEYPKSLEALLKDARYASSQRYLRNIYADPITGKTEWGLVQGLGGGVMGVYSLSERQPIKTANFSEANQAFQGMPVYSGWKFVYLPSQPTPPASGIANSASQ
jgi:type II secretory pathway pseudopilin PulG